MTRAERRRAAKASARAEQYEKSAFADNAIYIEPVRSERHPPFTLQQLHQRAVVRRDRTTARFTILAGVVSKHELARLVDSRAPHANRSTAERRHFDRSKDRERRRASYRRGTERAQPIQHMHSASRLRLAA